MTHPLQTKEWGEFRKEWGNEVLTTKYGIITTHKIPGTRYKIGVFEKGPRPTTQMTKELKKLGTKNNLIFIKIEPNFAKASLGTAQFGKLKKDLKSWGFTPGKTLFTPTTFVIDLSKSEEELLKSFSSKTRYNIRLAERKGVKVTEDNSGKAFKKYQKLTFDTAKRQGFYAHTPFYHKLMWKHLKDKIAHLLVAKYNNEIITTWILFAYDKVLYYPYGASSEKFKNVMANNLMMWEAIKFGKKIGCTSFDLWGREEGKGFTRFKEGYNPRVVEFIGSWDLVINKPLYYVYRIAEKLRWLLLRLKTRIS